MKINKFAFGDSNEAFIESRFKSGVNIIYTDTNNKGKTLVSQGIMYTLGNTPAFPDSIDTDKYYFYLEMEVGSKSIEFLRIKNSFTIRLHGDIHVFESTSDLKYFLNSNLFNIPRIEKGGEEKLVDPELLYEMFFIGQDKKDTSSITAKGYYNNDDFLNMLYSIKGIGKSSITSKDLEQLKIQKKEKNKRLKLLQKDQDKLGAETDVFNFVLEGRSDREISNKNKALKEIHEKISTLTKERNREVNRKLKFECLIDELNSLNMLIKSGSVACGECGSDNIVFRNTDIDFDISNGVVKNAILTSIKQKIEIKNEIIDRLEYRLSEERLALSYELKEVTPDYRDVLLYKDDIDKAEELEPEILELSKSINSIEEQLKTGKAVSEEEKSQQKNLRDKILSIMNEYSAKINSEDGGSSYANIFTKKNKIVSGSDAQVFYLCKLLAIREYFEHNHPIIIDDFRDKEISTEKEKNIIYLSTKIPNQVILTATLKEEEYKSGKYTNFSNINRMDFSSNEAKKILTTKDTDEFKKLLGKFSIITT